MVEKTGENYPVAIIGAGPIGLAAAAHLHERNMPFQLLERSTHVGASVHEWAHVRLFSPWQYLLDSACQRLLEALDWQRPNLEVLPTGQEFLNTYLTPLSQVPEISAQLQFNCDVVSVGRLGLDKLKTEDRENQPFELHMTNGTRVLASSVIDASGTWQTPNPVGSGGSVARGEVSLQDRILYGIPEVLGRYKKRLAGKRVLVVGSGHSAMTCLLELLQLKAEVPTTSVFWGARKRNIEEAYGGGKADALPARGALGLRVKEALSEGMIELVSPIHISAVEAVGNHITVTADKLGQQVQLEVDEVIGVTGFRPNLDMLRELRIELDPWVEAPTRLAPLVDPNLHSCGTVYPNGALELAHPEKGFLHHRNEELWAGTNFSYGNGL